MKIKTYLLTLLLFLLFFDGSIVLISVMNLKSSLDSTRQSCLMENDFITATLAKDMNAMESRGTKLESALQPLLDSYVGYYAKQNVYLKLSQNGKVLYSSTPQEQRIFEEQQNPPTGKRIIRSLQFKDRDYIQVSGVPSALYDTYILSYYYDYSQIIAAWKRTTNLLLLIGVGVSSLLAVCLIFMLNQIFKPLRQVSQASQSVAKGDYSGRLPVSGHDELSDMASSFNNMADEIENQIAKLAESAEQKQRFVDNFAHELRTPLTSIYGFAEYMQKAAITEEDKLEATGYIMSESLRLQNLAYRLLDLASLRNDEITFALVDVEELFHSTVGALRGKAAKSQVKLQYECDFGQLNGDRDLLQSLMVNLTDNAIKSCRCTGEVKIKASMENGAKVISVCDNGSGMTQEQMNHIMEAFYRVDKARSRAEGGVGLGLSLCKQIAACHGAELCFDSQPGLGTMAKITFTTS